MIENTVKRGNKSKRKNGEIVCVTAQVSQPMFNAIETWVEAHKNGDPDNKVNNSVFVRQAIREKLERDQIKIREN